jgi:uncharacterized phage protein (TIGR02220 family)
LLRASHKETWTPVRTGRGFTEVELKPGSFIFGRYTAATDLRMSPSTVWRRILKLKNLEIIDIQTDTHFTIIYIINWHIYQAEQQNSDRQPDRQRTGNGHKQKQYKKNIYSRNALEVLSYLNSKTGRRYRDASYIEARLKDGGTLEDCIRIIDAKLKDPFFIENPRHLNPITLFRKTHWDKYLNEPEVKQNPWS